jgi:uncharacterized membrane protein
LTVGSVWIAHHNMFTFLRWIDPVLLRLNLLLLMAAAFLPFPTGVLAQAFHASDDAERAAIVFYGATALVIEVLLRVTIRYARSRPELLIASAQGPLPEPQARERDWSEAVGGAIYGAGILVGVFLFPKVAAALYLLVAIRGVFVIGGEGRLGLRALLRR